jgi:hypothetical protein
MVYARSALFSLSFPILRQIAEKHKIGKFFGLRPGKLPPSRHHQQSTRALPLSGHAIPNPIGSPHQHSGHPVADRLRLTPAATWGSSRKTPSPGQLSWSSRSLPSLPAGEYRPHSPPGLSSLLPADPPGSGSGRYPFRSLYFLSLALFSTRSIDIPGIPVII